jgi:uncharacterized protein YkwD
MSWLTDWLKRIWPLRPHPSPPRPPAPPRPPVPPPPAPPPSPAGDVAQALLDWHNNFRSSRGVGTLRLDPRLVATAQAHSVDMAVHGFLGHGGSDGSSPFQRMTLVGYGYTWAGENAAEGQPDAAAVCAAWRDDPPHRENMLGGHYRDVGFGMARDAAGTPYWTADFGSTMMTFGDVGAGRDPFEEYPSGTCARAYRPRPA